MDQETSQILDNPKPKRVALEDMVNITPATMAEEEKDEKISINTQEANNL